MIMALPDEMYKYMNTDGEKSVIIHSAPESIKEEAREINKIAIDITGSEYFVIEN